MVETAAVITHGVPALVEDALERVRALAARLGVKLVDDDAKPDIAIVLGGDGSMLRALTRYLGSGVPVLGVNFGRVGFLTAIAPDARAWPRACLRRRLPDRRAADDRADARRRRCIARSTTR